MDKALVDQAVEFFEEEGYMVWPTQSGEWSVFRPGHALGAYYSPEQLVVAAKAKGFEAKEDVER